MEIPDRGGSVLIYRYQTVEDQHLNTDTRQGRSVLIYKYQTVEDQCFLPLRTYQTGEMSSAYIEIPDIGESVLI